MTPWNELKLPFRNALIDAFDESSLTAMLQYRCHRRLDRLSGRSEPLDNHVDKVITNAVRLGWLDCLAAGALAENQNHSALAATVPLILDGIEALGKAYYQAAVAGIPLSDTIYVELRPYLEWLQRRSSKLPLAPLDPSGRDSELISASTMSSSPSTLTGREKDILSNGRDAVYSAATGHLHGQKKQLLLLGDPGSGKSTLLRYLALCLCSALLEPQAGWLEKLQWTVKDKKEEGREGSFLRSGEEEKDRAAPLAGKRPGTHLHPTARFRPPTLCGK